MNRRTGADQEFVITRLCLVPFRQRVIMRDSKWFRNNVDWWEREWCMVLSSEARLCWILLLCRAASVGHRGVLEKSPVSLLSRQWLVGEESVRQMLTAAVMGGELAENESHWEVVDKSIFSLDPTATERKRAERERLKMSQLSRDGRDVTDVTTHHITSHHITSTPKSPKGDLDFAGAECPDVLRVSALAWQAYRRERKLSWVKSTWESNFRQYAEDPAKFTRMVDHTIDKGWQGLVDPNDNRPVNVRSAPKNPHASEVRVV